MYNGNRLELKCRNSTKTTNYLFDYESKHNLLSTHTITSSCSITPTNSSISINKNINNDDPLLIKLINPDKYHLTINAQCEDKVHLDISKTYSYENNGYEIKVGDVITFGSISFKVLKIQINEANIDNNNSISPHNDTNNSESNNNNNNCNKSSLFAFDISYF